MSDDRQNIFNDEDRKTLYKLDVKVDNLIERVEQMRVYTVIHEHRTSELEGDSKNRETHDKRIRSLEQGFTRLRTIWSAAVFIIGFLGTIFANWVLGLISGSHPK